MAMDSKLQVQVISRAAAILRALEHENAGLSLAQIASRVDLPRSTVQRIVAALAQEKLLTAATPTERVRLGPDLLRLASSVTRDAAAIAHPFLAQLSALIRETVDFSVPRHDHLVFVDQVIGPERLRMVSSIGDAFPLYCTANGKAYLATLDDAEILRRIGEHYPARTAKTPTSLPRLMEGIRQIRLTGIAFDEEENGDGVSAAGVCLHDMLGNPVAISVPVPSPRFAAKRDAIVAGLLATAATLREKFGQTN